MSEKAVVRMWVIYFGGMLTKLICHAMKLVNPGIGTLWLLLVMCLIGILVAWICHLVGKHIA